MTARAFGSKHIWSLIGETMKLAVILLTLMASTARASDFSFYNTNQGPRVIDNDNPFDRGISIHRGNGNSVYLQDQNNGNSVKCHYIQTYSGTRVICN